jgi:hypothetical protein
MKKKLIRLLLILSAAMLCSCVSAGFLDFTTAEPLAPLHVSFGPGAEINTAADIPDFFAAARIGVFPGFDLGVRGGIGSILGDVKYRLPLDWKEASIAVGLGGGVNFNNRIAEIFIPLRFSYALLDNLRLAISQQTVIFPGDYKGFAVSAGLGLKWNIGPFFLFPNAIGGYFAPEGGAWTRKGSGLVSSYREAEEGPLGAFGLSIGLDL